MKDQAQHLKAKALPAIVLFPLTAFGSSASLTSGSNHSLRSLGRAKARPLT
jgi:protoheme ferro-lyase